MIIRVWRGWVARGDGDAYEEYIRDVTIDGYAKVDGNRGGYLTRRADGDREEFCMISFWDSMDAVTGFAGPDPEVAVFYPRDDEFLLEREERVTHYTVFATMPGT